MHFGILMLFTVTSMERAYIKNSNTSPNSVFYIIYHIQAYT